MSEGRKSVREKKKSRLAEELEKVVNDSKELAKKLGLKPQEVNYWVVDHDEVNRIVAYDGFPIRYPHWRWGMKYDRQKKQSKYTPARIYELVTRDKPCHAFLQVSNKMADQKAIIVHVEAHADFFANNRWFKKTEGGALMLERHAEKIQKYMEENGREEVEKWIDNLLCIEDNIDQHGDFERTVNKEERENDDFKQNLDELGISKKIREEVFDEKWIEEQAPSEKFGVPKEPQKDLMLFLAEYGKKYDEDREKAEKMEDWRKEIIQMLRKEAYYFAPQKMTKVMNEGWSAYWESIMMSEFADSEEFLDHADLQSKILGSDGLNPYKLGKELWEYIENRANRQEVAEKILKVEGINPRNFKDIDFDRVRNLLSPSSHLLNLNPENLLEINSEKTDKEKIKDVLNSDEELNEKWKLLSYKGLAELQFSLNKPENYGILEKTSNEKLESIYRYISEKNLYSTLDDAIRDVDYTAGWERMKEVRETHNDVTFIDEFLTQEFVDENNYFTYEYSRSTNKYKATSTDYEDVKKKLLLEFTNFGKPTIKIHDSNYRNAGELLLVHYYNGIELDIEKAKQTLKRIFKMWGRPVNLKTIKKDIDDVVGKKRREPDGIEKGLIIRYDGDSFHTNEINIEKVRVSDTNYDTTPDNWI